MNLQGVHRPPGVDVVELLVNLKPGALLTPFLERDEETVFLRRERGSCGGRSLGFRWAACSSAVHVRVPVELELEGRLAVA